jgi:two-component system sensor histidine kinase YesM
MTIDKKKEKITFREEIQIVLDYVHIMNMRQREKVEIEISVDEEASSMRIPRFILQPIIENSIIHGLNQSAGKIKILTEVFQDEVLIKIEDNGQGMGQEALSKLQSNIIQTKRVDDTGKEGNSGFSSLGLSNVYERMLMSFGASFKMEIKSKPGLGTQVILIIPKGGSKSYVQSDAS